MNTSYCDLWTYPFGSIRGKQGEEAGKGEQTGARQLVAGLHRRRFLSQVRPPVGRGLPDTETAVVGLFAQAEMREDPFS